MNVRMRPVAPRIRLINLLAVASLLMSHFVHQSGLRDFLMGFGTVMLVMQIFFMSRSSNCTRSTGAGPV